jgi:hypothetical protein
MLRIFLGALFLSILACIMFLFHDVGLSLLIFFVSFFSILLFLLNQKQRIINKKYLILILPILLLASTYFIFYNNIFRVLNFIVIFILLVIMFMGALSKKFNISTFISNCGNLVLGSVDAITDIKEETHNANFKISFNIKVLKALLITVPIIIIVIILLSKSEALFSNALSSCGEFFRNILSFNFKSVLQRIVFVSIGTIIFTLFFYNIINNYQEEEVCEYPKKELQDLLTFKILLISLNIIYLVYVILQISTLVNYLINGGISNYAEYARSGFFELMAVSFINFVIALLTFRYKDVNKTLKVLNTIMLIFTFILIIGALLRMRFYEIAYGFTTLRLLVYFILITEGVMLIPSIIYIWKNNFSIIKTYSIIILTSYIILNFINLDYIIAKENVNRYFKSGKIDINYLIDNLGPNAYFEITRLEYESNYSLDIENFKYYVRIEAEKWDTSIWSYNIIKNKIRNSFK